MAPSGIRRARQQAVFAVVAILFFHQNGIAGDAYQTLTLALVGAPVLTVGAMAALAFLLKLAATVTS